MISQVETEKRNLESSLLFMQQEHSTTLKALHEEISKLQKRCRGMEARNIVSNFYCKSSKNRPAVGHLSSRLSFEGQFGLPMAVLI